VLDSISAHIAILDEKGAIIETNRAWRDYAERNLMQGVPDSLGINYLNICEVASGEHAGDARKAYDGIRAVLEGDIEEFLHDYPCHSPETKHWFYMRAIRVTGMKPVRVIVSHENITELKLAEEALRESREAVSEQKQSLEEANIALKVLLKQRESDKTDLERNVLSNVKTLVFPYVERLKKARLKPKEKTLVGIIDTHLKDIVSPLLQHMTNASILLTPQEIQVATLVKDGKTSKEIADILFISETTVHFHRKNLRKKFGLKNRQTNLRAYLMSMTMK
jgi:DNA-binding CsgD family transcriptional regulator